MNEWFKKVRINAQTCTTNKFPSTAPSHHQRRFCCKLSLVPDFKVPSMASLLLMAIHFAINGGSTQHNSRHVGFGPHNSYNFDFCGFSLIMMFSWLPSPNWTFSKQKKVTRHQPYNLLHSYSLLDILILVLILNLDLRTLNKKKKHYYLSLTEMEHMLPLWNFRLQYSY